MPGPVLTEDPLLGVALGHYRVTEKIGSGGVGVVYRAHDQHLDREVAIKVLLPGTLADESARKHFRKEALALSKLNHPNIATIHDFDTQGGVDFLVMEYIPGIALSEKLTAGRLPEKEALRLGIQVAEGLAAAHEHGVVHRDLKPGNLRLTGDGRLKILDFGLAKLRQPSTESAATESVLESRGITGTLPYMAPEQVLGGAIDARTDIHAAGLVLYEMATGRRPFADVESPQLIGAILHRSPPPASTINPTLSPELGRIIGKCLEKEPENRYQSAKELAIDLRRLQTGVPTAVAPSEAAPRARRWRVSKVVVSAGVVAIAAMVVPGVLFVRSHKAYALTDKDTIVLADLDNKTGDSVFDDTLKQGLSVQLEQSPFLALVSDRKVNETLKLMGRSPDDRLTPEVTREVCQRTGSRAMVRGSIVGLGSQYVIGLKAVTCDSGDVLAQAQEQAAGKEAVLKALDAAAVSLRSKLGESLGSVQKYATPLEEATTPSLEALKAYSVGVKTQNTKRYAASLPFFKRAVELDPNFAQAYQQLGSTYFDTNQAKQGAEYIRKAYDLREKVSQRERFRIEGSYFFMVTGELEKAAQMYELWQQTYPRDERPYTNLGFVTATLGKWDRALEQFQAAMSLDPSFGASYLNLGIAYTVFNRFNEAEAVYTDSERRKLENEFLLQSRYWLAFLKSDTAQMAQFLSAAMGKPGAEDLLLATQADTDGWHGRLTSARELTKRAAESALRNDAKEAAAVYQAAAALREVEAGNRDQALYDAKSALMLAPNRDVRAIAALALARAGETAAAEKLAAELDKAYPLDTLVHRYWLPTIRAGVALQRKDPRRAIELLETASTIEFSEPSQFTVFLCPVYVRGEAYRLLGDGDKAAGEFQKFIDHRGLVMNFPWGALARLGLARAYALQSDTSKARAAYQDFLTLWKDADPDIPILKQAKAEYAQLK